MRMRLIVLVINFLNIFAVAAQVKQNIQFGKINPAEFNTHAIFEDSTTPAIVLSDIGSTEFEGNSTGNFTLVYKHHKRILIKNRKGFEAATILIALYNGDNSASTEKLDDFEATTYTYENGKIVSTKVKKSDVLVEKTSKESVLRKFTFPNVQEGCILEFRLKIKSPFYDRLRSWNFQSEYPTIWSEYKVVIPPLFDYLSSSYGYLDYAVNELSYLPKTYTIRDPISKVQDNTTYSISGEALVNVWAVKDAPPFKRESFVYSHLNHIKRIQFQLKAINYSATSSEKKIKSWPEVAKDLLADEDFGAGLAQPNNWLNDEIGRINNDKSLESCKTIYEYVRNNFICTDYESKWLSQPIKKTFDTKTGTAADLNMLLIAMLRKAGFQADPLIVSTRENGFTNPNYALPSQFNYTLCMVKFKDKTYILDASHKRIGFGDIPMYCYNGIGRIINLQGSPFSLSPDMLLENSSISVKVTNEQHQMNVAITINYGKIEGLRLREQIAKQNESEVVKNITAKIPAEFKLIKFSFDSLNLFDKALQLRMLIQYTPEAEGSTIYFNPILLNEWVKNPFISTTRNYPVELPYRIKEAYQIEIEIPSGYRVDELPVSMKQNLNNSDIKFEYNSKADEKAIIITSSLITNKTVFQKTEYNALRTYFMNLIKKYEEQIVFKK